MKPSFDFLPYSTERRSNKREPRPEPVPPPTTLKIRKPWRPVQLSSPSADELLRMEELAVCPGPNFIDRSGLEIYKNHTRHMLSSPSFAEEGVKIKTMKRWLKEELIWHTFGCGTKP